MFIGQHAGGGKAEQIFLRGFDIDHGTDIEITADGMPVNMVSHAHGQGYADLHFIIPETVDKIDFGKGPYHAEKGNFNTAGYVNFKTKEKLDQSSIKLESGMFNTNRLLGAFNILNNNKHSAYFASEFLFTDGPFDSPQNFNRVNVFGKYTGNLSNNNKIGITSSYFTSRWDASGQIPQRAVDNGSIGRFGAIDDTEGGTTSRTNLLIDHKKSINENSFITSKAYYVNYNFDLFSNFTFYLNDSINGDQIRQEENRDIFGLKSEYNYIFSNEKIDRLLKVGINLRKDQSKNNGLSKTVNRSETLYFTQLGEINELNLGGYVDATFDIGKWSINTAVRLDQFDFQYNDALALNYQTQSVTKAIVSPKLNILFNPNNNLQLYLKNGKGFHSNDTRVIVSEQGKEILPAAYGSDIGFIGKPSSKIVINAAYWYLYLEQEFVYVGDEGVVEPSGETFRQGMDFSFRYQPLKWLFWNIDVNYTHARALEEPKGEDYIPLAPDLTAITGLSVLHDSGIYGGINARYIKDRPANEDNSIVAIGYTIIDLKCRLPMEKFQRWFSNPKLIEHRME